MRSKPALVLSHNNDLPSACVGPCGGAAAEAPRRAVGQTAMQIARTITLPQCAGPCGGAAAEAPRRAVGQTAMQIARTITLPQCAGPCGGAAAEAPRRAVGHNPAVPERPGAHYFAHAHALHVLQVLCMFCSVTIPPMSMPPARTSTESTLTLQDMIGTSFSPKKQCAADDCRANQSPQKSLQVTCLSWTATMFMHVLSSCIAFTCLSPMHSLINYLEAV